MLAQQLKKLRNRDNISQAKLAITLGITQQAIAKWETNKATPDPDMLNKIADYFHVSADYLLGREKNDNNLPELNAKDERDIAKELEKMMNNLDSDSGLSFYGQPLTDENKEILRASLENTLRMSKALAKKKFTPKKYRKEE